MMPTKPVDRRILLLAGVLVATGAVAGTTLYRTCNRADPPAGTARNYLRSQSAPAGTMTTELATASAEGPFVAAVPAVLRLGDDANDWPSYNSLLTSERYCELRQINTNKVAGLRVVCGYHTGQQTRFETGLIMVNGAWIGATDHDTCSLDAKTGASVWEFYLIPRGERDPVRGPRDGARLHSGSVVVLDARTGAYGSRFKRLPQDWPDSNVPAARAVIATLAARLREVHDVCAPSTTTSAPPAS